MPSVSKKQHSLMGLAYAIKSGRAKKPKKLTKALSGVLKMPQSQLEEFARTKSKKLPLRKSVKLSKKNKKMVSH